MDYCNIPYRLCDLDVKQHFLLGGEDYVKLFSIGNLVRCSDSAGKVVTFPAETEVLCFFEQNSLF